MHMMLHNVMWQWKIFANKTMQMMLHMSCGNERCISKQNNAHDATQCHVAMEDLCKQNNADDATHVMWQ